MCAYCQHDFFCSNYFNGEPLKLPLDGAIGLHLHCRFLYSSHFFFKCCCLLLFFFFCAFLRSLNLLIQRQWYGLQMITAKTLKYALKEPINLYFALLSMAAITMSFALQCSNSYWFHYDADRFREKWFHFFCVSIIESHLNWCPNPNMYWHIYVLLLFIKSTTQNNNHITHSCDFQAVMKFSASEHHRKNNNK